MTSRPTRFGRWLAFTAAFGLVAVAAVACKKDGAPAASGGGAAAEGAAKKAPPAVRDGLSEDWRLDHPDCPDARKVTTPVEGTPEATLWQVFQAASGPDTEEGFQKFYAAMDPDKYTEEWARAQFWERSRGHVSKYVESETDPSFIVCRTEPKSETRTKLYIFSKDSTKTHTPCGLEKIGDGPWKIEFFTP